MLSKRTKGLSLGALATLFVTLCLMSNLIDAASLIESRNPTELTKNQNSNDIPYESNTNIININHSIDAPKYYERNSLLYKSPKSSNANTAIDDLKPLDGARINPKDMTLTSSLDEDDESSSIDGLIRVMRRKENRATEPGVSYYGPRNKEGMVDTISRGTAEDDEASVQRKSTNIEADSSLSPGTSSRLRVIKGKYPSLFVSCEGREENR